MSAQTIVYPCDLQSGIFWEVHYSGTASPIVGRYVMGDPWVAVPDGHSATVVRVGRFTSDPGSTGTFPGVNAEDAAYPGPKTPVSGSGTGYRHGTMKNPLGGGTLGLVPDPSPATPTEMLRSRQLGYDDRIGDFYDPAGTGGVFVYPGMLVGPGGYLPINDGTSQSVTLVPGDVLVSTISNPSGSTGNCQFPPRWETIYETCGGTCSNGNRCGASPTKQAAVLSLIVLDENTPVDGAAFRRPYSLPTASDRRNLPHRTLADIDWLALPRAAWPSGTGYPAASSLAPLVSRVWLDHHANLWAEDALNPTDHMAGYGQYQREMLCGIAATVCLNPDGTSAAPRSASPLTNAAFRRMVYGVLQAGIDTWGLMQQPTHTFNANGGKGGGRKFAVVFAGKMLGVSAYQGIAAGLPSMANGPWTVRRLVKGVLEDVDRFVEDEQVFAADPLDASRTDWDWQGSPWKWGFDSEDRSRQGMLPAQWDLGECEGETKRFLSTSAYVGMAIALRMFQLEAAWSKRAFFGYMDRWMVPAHAGISAAYDLSQHTGLHGLTGVSRGALELIPGGTGNLSLAVWDRYRWLPDPSAASTAPVLMRPDGFTFDQPVPSGTGGNCAGLRKPTLLTQFVPSAGNGILLEMHAGEEFTAPAPMIEWLALYMGGGHSSVPIPVAGPYNSDDLYLSASLILDAVVLFDVAFGYSAHKLQIPSSAVGLEVAFQFAMLEDPIFSCIAFSNALVLRIQP